MFRTSLPRLATAVLLVSSAASQNTLETTFASNSRGSVGGAVFFDVEALTSMAWTRIDLNLDQAVGAAGSVDVYVRSGSYVGNTASAAGWTLASTAGVTAAGPDVPSPAALSVPVLLPVGSHAIAVVHHGVAARYTSGAMQVEACGELAIEAGAAQNSPFSGVAFTPRTANLRVHYVPGPDALAFGIDCRPIGAASLDRDGERLSVHNLGASGRDGVRMELGGTQGFGVDLGTDAIDSTHVAELAFRGNGGGASDMVFATVTVAGTGGAATVTIDTAPLGGVHQDEFERDGVVVARPATSIVQQFDVTPFAAGKPIRVSATFHADGGLRLEVGTSEGMLGVIARKKEVADHIVRRVSPPNSAPAGGWTSAELRIGGRVSMAIGDMGHRLGDATVVGLCSTEVRGDPNMPGLQIRGKVGDMDDDGVQIRLGTAEAAEFSFDPPAVVRPGAQLRVAAFGDTSTGSDVSLGSMSQDELSGQWQVRIAFDAAATQQRVEAVRQGTVVHRTVVPVGLAGTCSALPSSCGKLGGRTPCFKTCYDNLVLFQAVDGTSVLCDELRFLRVGGAEVLHKTRMELTARGLDEVVLTDVKASKLHRIGRSLVGSSGTPRLTIEGRPDVGNSGFGLLAHNLVPQSSAFLLLGLPADPPVDLGPLGAPGGEIGVLAFDALLVQVEPDGTASWSLPIPNQPALVRAALATQAVDVDPAHPNALGVAHSRVLVFRIEQ